MRAWRSARWRCALSCAVVALVFALQHGPVALGQSNMQSLFDGVRMGTANPECIDNVVVAYAEAESEDSQEQEFGPEISRLQQPGGAVEGGAPPVVGQRLAQAQQLATEQLPPPPPPPTTVRGTVPIAGWDDGVEMAPGPNGRIERLVVRDASLSKVLSLLAQTYNLNIVAANDIDAVISITLRDVALEEALTAILSVANYTWVDRDGIILITSLTDSGQLSPEVQGRCIQVFDLDFASATVVSEAVSAFLSPIGKLSTATSDPADSRRTREMIIVEDIPDAIARIAAYIRQVDSPPRQVLIEAHIFQVTLRDNEKNGVDFDALARVAGANIHLKTVGFAPLIGDTADGTGFFATIEGGDLSGVIELLQTTTNTKTLGSPKVLVLNQQEARIHVGEDLGYQTTVTTELQSSQAPQFLQVGVLLTITPRITRDNRVLLTVHPEVSTGAIDPLTQVPNKRTTELDTDVMLRDGQGMVIGGLIDEQDHTSQQKIPYLGDLWRVGFFFRKSDIIKERKEVIIAIVPRILPYSPDYENFEQGELIRAESPLFRGPLCYNDRPFDAHIPDGKRVAKPYIPTPANRPQFNRAPCNYCEGQWPKYYVPPKPYPRQRLVDERAPGYYPGEYEYSGEVEGCAEPAFDAESHWPQPQPEYAEEYGEGYNESYGEEYTPEYSSEFSGDFSAGGATISDQP